jgi:hypothetical protein
MAAAADGAAVLGILVAVGVVVGVIAWGIFRNAGFEEAAKEAARKLGGSFVPGGWLDYDRIQLTGTQVEFHAGSKNNPAFSRVTIDARGRSPGVLKIFPEGFGYGILKMFGAQDLRIGDAGFDDRYVVKANPEQVAQRAFAPESRAGVIALLERLSRLGAHRVDLSPESLIVTVQVRLSDAASIVALAECAQEFRDRLLEDRGGVTIVATGSEGRAACQVCGSELKEDVVRCLRCQTPHHRECWEYSGACSTFACGEIGFR